MDEKEIGKIQRKNSFCKILWVMFVLSFTAAMTLLFLAGFYSGEVANEQERTEDAIHKGEIFQQAARDALKSLRQVYEEDPQLQKNLKLIADLNIMLERFDDLEIDTGESGTWLEELSYPVKNDTISEVENEAKNELKENKIQAELYHKRANRSKLQNKLERAECEYDLAIEFDPKNGDIYYDRGTLYYLQGRHAKAEQDFSDALKYKPEFADAYNARGEMRRFQGKLKLAKQDLDKALELKPKFAFAYHNRGILNGLQSNYQDAEKDLSAAIAIDKDYLSAYFSRAGIYELDKKYSQAEKDYEKVIELNPKYAEVYFKRAILYTKQGKWEKADRDLAKVSELKPDFAEAYNIRGELCRVQKKYQQANSYYLQAIALTASGIYYQNLGKLRQAQGKHGEAIAQWQKAIELSPTLKAQLETCIAKEKKALENAEK